MENLVTGIVDALKSNKSDIEPYRDELDEIFTNLYFKGIGADNRETSKAKASTRQLDLFGCSGNIQTM